MKWCEIYVLSASEILNTFKKSTRVQPSYQTIFLVKLNLLQTSTCEICHVLFSAHYIIWTHYIIMIQKSSLVTRLGILKHYLMSSSSFLPGKILSMILLYEQVNNGNHIKGKSTHKTEPLNMNYRVFSQSVFCRPRGSLRTSDGEGTDIKTPFNTASTQAEELSALACAFSSRWVSSSSSSRSRSTQWRI